MDLILFYKAGQKNINIDYFKYNFVNASLIELIKEGISEYNVKIEEYAIEEYNPLATDRGRKVLENLDLNSTLQDSKLLNIYSEILDNKKVESKIEDDLGYTYNIKEVTGFHESDYPISFYAIKFENKIYFKKTNEAKYFLKNKMQILTHIEEARVKEMSSDLMLIDTNFDFHFDLDQNEIFIRVGNNFETISSYEIVYEKHREEILSTIESQDIIENFDGFKRECGKKYYLRVFKKVPPHIIVKNTLKNVDFIEKLIKDTQNQISWNEEKTKIVINHNQVKTVIHLLSGLIGIDVYDDVVTFNQKERVI